MEILFSKYHILFVIKDLGWKLLSCLLENDIRVYPIINGGHLRILFIDFLAYRLGHLDFEIKFIDSFASNVIQMAFIAQECIWYLIIYSLEAHLIKFACLHIHFYPSTEEVCIACFLKKNGIFCKTICGPK